jgi:hypothetical protein
MEKTVFLRSIEKSAWSMKKIATWSALNKQTMMKMMSGTTLLIFRLHAITDIIIATQQGSYILHPSIGAVFFDVIHLVDLRLMLQLVRFGGSQLHILAAGLQMLL